MEKVLTKCELTDEAVFAQWTFEAHCETVPMISVFNFLLLAAIIFNIAVRLRRFTGFGVSFS